MMLAVSIVIPTYNEEKNIGKCLGSILNGSEMPFEIIVADGGSNDSTLAIAQSFDVEVVNNPKRHAAGGRNAGIEVASGDVVAFIDADCFAEADWVREIRKSFEHGDIDGLGTKIEPAECVNEYDRFWSHLNYRILWSYGDEEYYVKNKSLREAFVTASCAYKKDLLVRLGGFSDWFANNAEDIDLCWRAFDLGAKLKYEPRALIYASSPSTLKGIRKKSFRNGISSSKLQKVYGGRINFDIQIYKQLGQNLCRALSRQPDARLYVYELFWHLLGKYWGSLKVGVVNV